MPTVRHPFSRHRTPPKFWLVYVLAFLVNLQAFIVAYSNSSFIEQFTNPEVVGLLYTVGSCLAILAFLAIARILRKVGNTIFTLSIALIQLIALLILALSQFPPLILTFFVVFLVTGPLLYMSLDVFSEALIGNNEDATGGKRGLTLSLMSLAGATGPFMMGFMVGENGDNLAIAYLASAVFGFLFIALVLIHFRHFNDPQYTEVRVMDTLQTFFKTPDMRNVFLTHLSLQMFFAWTVIYMPLYLSQVVGLTWTQIGTVLAIGLLAYVVCEWPIGQLADKKWGEKEMMAIGFLVIISTLAAFAFFDSPIVYAWAALFFINRVGASLVEVTTESYFFKHTKGTDANLISFFRLTRPLGLVIGSLIGSAALLYVPFNLAFVVFAFCLVPAMLLTTTITDTR